LSANSSAEARSRIARRAAVKLERFVNAAHGRVARAAEQPGGAREAGLGGKRLAQCGLGLVGTHQLLQHDAVVVERVGPIRALLQHGLELARRARRVALRFEQVEQRRARIEVARLEGERAPQRVGCGIQAARACAGYPARMKCAPKSRCFRR
jgi:hypothetical protein